MQKGKRQFEKTKLEYSKEIIMILEENPDFFEEILNELGVTKQNFFGYISGDMYANITFYDQKLESIKRRIKDTK